MSPIDTEVSKEIPTFVDSFVQSTAISITTFRVHIEKASKGVILPVQV